MPKKYLMKNTFLNLVKLFEILLIQLANCKITPIDDIIISILDEIVEHWEHL